MKKIISIVLVLVSVFAFSSCAPTNVKTEAQKRNEEIMAEEDARLKEILEKAKAEEETPED